uniref:Uncharacterized protein n=1 Tax=Anopheles albimanus TaxID=7167 RepID=A0A182F7C1_ANOAL
MTDTKEAQVELVVDVSKCCRLCLVADEEQKYGYIFKHALLTENSVSIVEAIQKVTGLDVSSDARLPERICYGCCTKLEDSFRFINEVVSNNEILLELVNPESSKVEQAGYALNFEDASGNESPGRAPKPPERVPESPERTHEPPERAQEPPERVQESPGRVPESPERALEPPSPRQRNNRKSRETTPAGSNEDDSTGTCSDGEPSDAPASADELDAVNLIVKKFINNRETKSRPPCGDKRRKVHRCSLCDKMVALGTTDNDEDTKEPSSKSPPPPTPRDPSPTRRTTPNDLGPISDANGHGLHAAAATRKTKQK